MRRIRHVLGMALIALGLLAGWPALAADRPATGPGLTLTLQPARASSQPSDGKHRGRLGRALLEEGVLWTISTLYYWSEYNQFTIDWQFTWKTFGRKFFTAESPRFDSNSFWSNWTHGPQGALYYTMARANGLSSLSSTLFSFGTSFLWESLSEWREVISINDQIFSTFGGPAAGEPFYQVSSYFGHRRGFWNGAASFLFDPILAFNNWLDHRHGPSWDSAPAADWHRFCLYAGPRFEHVSPVGTTAVARSGSLPGQFNVGLDMETDSVPRAGDEPGGRGSRRSLSDTLSSRLAVDLSYGSSGLEEIQMRSSAVLFGSDWASNTKMPDGSLRGGDVSLGFGTAFELFKKRPVAWYDSRNEVEGGGQARAGEGRLERPTPTRFTDKLSVISPAGAVLVLSRFGPRHLLRWTSAIFGDFALVNALAYNRYTEAGDISGIKTTLLNWGYYYGLGMTVASDVAWDWRQWRCLAAASYQWYASIQGLDRYQYEGLITNDFRIHDERLTWRLRLGYRLKGTPVELALGAEGIDRRGALLGFHERYWERRVLSQLRLAF